MERGDARLTPLVLATMASQALLVVLSPTIVAIGDDLGSSVGAVGQARSISAVVAITASIAIAGRIDEVGVPRLLRIGAVMAVTACAGVALAPTLAWFLAAHVLVGVAFACLLSAGFAGVAAFASDRRGWAIGHVAGANALAWIVVNPAVGAVTDLWSWRAAQAVPAAIAIAALVAPKAVASASGAPLFKVRTLLIERSARRWIAAELIAYGAWTALLTFVGAYFIESLEVGQGAVGWLLASGAITYFVSSSRSGVLVERFPRRRLIAGSAVVMAALAVALVHIGSVALAVGTFCLIGLAAGIRTPASSGLGLEQLPRSPGAMMAGRTAATQLGYLLGAVIGGAVIAGSGYGALGIVLAVGMVASAWLILGVDDPVEPSTAERAALP